MSHDISTPSTWLVGGLVAIFYFPINIGLLIIPIDFHIFERGWNHQPAGIEPSVHVLMRVFLAHLPAGKLLNGYWLLLNMAQL